MKPEKGTNRIMTQNYAAIVFVCLLLVASTIIMPQGNLSAYAQQAEEEEEANSRQQEQDRREALVNLRALLGSASSGTDLEGLLGDLIDARDLDALAGAVGESDSSELTQNPRVTDSEGLGDLIDVTSLRELLGLVGLSDLQELLDLLIQPRPQPPTEEPPQPPTEEPPQPPTEEPPQPPTEEPPQPPTEEPPQPPTGESFTAEIISSGTEGVAPATFEFEANVIDGTEPYTYSWNFGDGSEEVIDEDAVTSHTFEQAGTYNVVLTITDAGGRTASDSVAITITGGEEEEPPATTAEGEEAVEEQQPPEDGDGEDLLVCIRGGGPPREAELTLEEIERSLELGLVERITIGPCPPAD
jgi:hypothetical protein